MTLPHYDSVRDIPLTNDHDVLERLQFMLESAIRRQVWLMFLDEDDRQLPIIMPTDVPRLPEPDDDVRVGAFLRDVGDDLRAQSVILVFERRGGPELSASDLEWLRVLRRACVESGMPFRGPYLCHRQGVSAVPADDLL